MITANLTLVLVLTDEYQPFRPATGALKGTGVYRVLSANGGTVYTPGVDEAGQAIDVPVEGDIPVISGRLDREFKGTSGDKIIFVGSAV